MAADLSEEELRDALDLSTQLAFLERLKPAQHAVGWREGEHVHVLPGFWNKKHAYCVSIETPNLEGWLPGTHVIFQFESDFQPPTLEEVLRRCSWVEVREEHRPTDSTELELVPGKLVRLLTVKQGWGYGWQVGDRNLAVGWFPLSLVQVVKPDLDRLKEELDADGAQGNQEDETESLGPPVSEHGADQGYQTHQTTDDYGPDASQVPDPSDYPAQFQHAPAPGPATVFDPYQMEAEDRYPLFVCKTAQDQRDPAMLQIEVGDLIRVTSPLDAAFYSGFRQGNQQVKGWFPNTSVERIANDAQPSMGTLTVPEMEEIPTWVIQPPMS